jgi:four helix bundle protein
MSTVQRHRFSTLNPIKEESMAKIKKFEDIESWKRARKLTKDIYTVTAQGKFLRDFGLKDQIRRATVSILSNIAEGFERGGDKEFLQFLAIAKGSSGEVRAQLYVALDLEYISSEQFEALALAATEVSQLLSGFMKYLRESALRGSRYR